MRYFVTLQLGIYNTALLVFAFLFAAIASPCDSSESSQVFRVPVNKQPQWVRSGVWDKTGTNLLLVDIFGGASAFSLSGHYIENMSLVPSDLGLQGFSGVQATPEGYIFENAADSKMVMTGPDMKLQSAMPVELIASDDESEGEPDEKSEATKSNVGVDAIFHWAFFGEEFLVFSDINQEEAPPWFSGFLRIPKADPESYELVLDLKLTTSDPMKTFYRLGLPYFTAEEDKGYALIMDLDPYVVEVSQGSEEVRIFDYEPEECDFRPELPAIRGASGTIQALQVLERSAGPAGIYAWNGDLYILCRGLGEPYNGWYLSQIDPKNGNLKSTKFLRTDAENMTVVPGASYWAFVEKGPLEENSSGLPSMEIKSILFADTKVVEMQQDISLGIPREMSPQPDRLTFLWYCALAGLAVGISLFTGSSRVTMDNKRKYLIGGTASLVFLGGSAFIVRNFSPDAEFRSIALSVIVAAIGIAGASLVAALKRYFRALRLTPIEKI